MKVFISWTGADRDVKNVIVERLKAENITCFDSDEHCTNDYSIQCIQNIKECDVFIALLSDASMQRGYVKNEVIAAREQEENGNLNIIIYKITESPLADWAQFQLNHLSYIERKETFGGESCIDIIIARTKILLEKRENGNPEKPMDVAVPKIKGLDICKTGYFVENSRNETFEKIDNAFAVSNVIIINELFGFGKRSAIRKYVELHRDEYKSIVLVENLNNNLRNFLMYNLEFSNINSNRFDNLEGMKLLKEKLSLLEKLDERTMVIIPDVDFDGEIDDYVCESLAGLKCKFVLLTQDTASAYRDYFPIIQLGRMEDEHLCELFFHHYTQAYEEEQEALIEPLQKFFSQIGGHTKTVELTASVLSRDLGVYPEDVPEYLSMSGTEGMQLKDRIINKISSLIDLEKLTEDEQKALVVASIVAIPNISEKSYRKILKNCGVEEWNTVVTLHEHRWIDLDTRNRTVSIEPLIADIVFKKYSDSYEALNACMTYFEWHLFNISIAGKGEKQYKKFELFMRKMKYDILADVVQMFLKALVDADIDKDDLNNLFNKFEKRYGDKKNLLEIEFDDDSTNDESFEARCANHAKNLINMLKIKQNDLGSLVFDMRMNAHNIQSDGLESCCSDVYSLITGAFDVEVEDIPELLAEIRRAEDFDDDEYDMFFHIVLASVMEAFCKRDYISMVESLESAFNYMLSSPQLMEDEGNSSTFVVIINLFATVLLNSGYRHNATALIEKSLPMISEMSNSYYSLLFNYTDVLYQNSEYGEKMYNAYEKLLANFDKVFIEAFDSRSDTQLKKKEKTLQYAESLAEGEYLEKAIEVFSKAMKINSGINQQVIEVADCIVNAMTVAGLYKDAVDFIKLYFYNKDISVDSSEISEEVSEKLQNMLDMVEFKDSIKTDFEALENQEQYYSYYHDYSRKNSFLVGKYYKIADKAMNYDFSSLSDSELKLYSNLLREKAKEKKKMDLAPEAFALVSEAGLRTLGYKHHYVQYAGAAVMADGKIAEIFNGEGKTYTIILTAYLNSLYGEKVFIVDSSKYLSERNYNWMSGTLNFLGVDVSLLQNVSDSHDEAYCKYNSDVIYADFATLALNELKIEINDIVKNEISYDSLIIDEADMLLVDKANERAALLSQDKTIARASVFDKIFNIAERVNQDDSYYSYKNGRITFKEPLYHLMEKSFDFRYDNLNGEMKTDEIEKILKSAIRCYHFVNGKDYYIRDKKACFEDRTTGKLCECVSIEDYFLCRMNGIDVSILNSRINYDTVTINAIYFKELFSRFKNVCGTTATAVSFKKEFQEIYSLDYVAMPPALPFNRIDTQSPVYLNSELKDEAILEMVVEKYSKQQPLLIITQDIDEADKYSELLSYAGVEHKVLNALNADDSVDIVAEAGVPGSVLIATALINRGVDIKLGGNPELITRKELVNMGVDITGLEDFLYSVPTPEQKALPLYNKYYSVLEKNKALVSKRRQAAIESGGLCVIGTSIFEDLRTEQQLRGRCGRQGDPGESRVFRSLDDKSIENIYGVGRIESFKEYCLNLGVEFVNANIVDKALKKYREKVHDSTFANVRSANDMASKFSKVRNEFIYVENIQSYQAFGQWCKRKDVLEDLSRLQKGDNASVNDFMRELYSMHYEKLKNVNGKKASIILFEIAQQSVANFKKRIKDGQSCSDEHFETIFDLSLRNAMKLAWKYYIGEVDLVFAKNGMSPKAINDYLETTKDRLKREAIEKFIFLK